MSPPERDWAAVLTRVIAGDRLALLQVARLVNGLLQRWSAYDFRDQWDDVVQDVVTAAALALREGRLREPAAALAYLLTTTRFKYVDRLRAHLRSGEREKLALGEALDLFEPRLGEDARLDLLRALAQLPEAERIALVAVYVEGWTYEEAAVQTGIPLGTLKRRLRDGLARLQQELK